MPLNLKNKGGRPTKMTTATLGKLRKAFLWGASDAEACLVAKIHPDTLYAYQKEHPEFSEEKEVCKLNPVLKARKTIYKNLDQVSAARWYLERRMRKEFGDELGSDADGHPRSIAELVAELGYVDEGA